MEDSLEGHVEDVRDAKGDFERGRVFVAFDGDDGLARDQDEVGEALLGHGVGGTEFAYGVAKSRAHSLPRSRANFLAALR